MINFKSATQKIIRSLNLLFFKKELPSKISLYFHETSQVEIDNIENLILYFKFNGYKFVKISEFAKKIYSTDKHIALTFDDAFESWNDVLPLLQHHNIKATFFINSISLTTEVKTNYLKNINHTESTKILSKKVFKKIIKDGHEIGGHTHSHPKLNKINYQEFKQQISKNVDILKNEGVDLKSFAIPFGMRRFITSKQLEYLDLKFESICFGEPGLLFSNKNSYINRTPWVVGESFDFNLKNISTDTRFFNFITRRSGLG